MKHFYRHILMIMLITSLSVFSDENNIVDCSVTVKLTDELSAEDAYELAKFKLCQKALKMFMHGKNMSIIRRCWQKLSLEKEVYSNPSMYFPDIKILYKEENEDQVKAKATITIDSSAIHDLLDNKTNDAIKKLNATQLCVFFLAKAGDEQTEDYKKAEMIREKRSELECEIEKLRLELMIEKPMIEDEDISSENAEKLLEDLSFSEDIEDITKRISDRARLDALEVELKLTPYKACLDITHTTRQYDTTEILTNITSSLNDSGIQLFSVQALLPYIEENKKLKSYLKIIKKEYAGYTNV